MLDGFTRLDWEMIGVILTLIAGFVTICTMLYRQGARDQDRQRDIEALCKTVQTLAEVDRGHADALQDHENHCNEREEKRNAEDAAFRKAVRSEFKTGSTKMTKLATTQEASVKRLDTIEGDIKTLLQRIPAKGA